MNKKTKETSKIIGNLDVFVTSNEQELEGKQSNWNEVLIDGDSDGLKSFADLLIEITNLQQEQIDHG